MRFHGWYLQGSLAFSYESSVLMLARPLGIVYSSFSVSVRNDKSHVRVDSSFWCLLTFEF